MWAALVTFVSTIHIVRSIVLLVNKTANHHEEPWPGHIHKVKYHNIIPHVPVSHDNEGSQKFLFSVIAVGWKYQ